MHEDFVTPLRKKEYLMAIVRLEPDSPVLNNTQTLPEVLGQPNQSLFTSLFPEASADSLLKYVEGYPWTCYFYGQLVSDSNSLEHFDPSTPNFTQPVYEVKDLILQVNSPLNSNYDPSTGMTTSTGSASMPLGMKPNVGDFFIAQIDSGEDAVFCITSVERKTYRKSTLYDINYSLYAYTSAKPEFITAVNARIQQTFFFNKDSNFFNRDVLITPSVKEAGDKLKEFVRESQEHYLYTFSDKRAGTIVLPGTSSSLYDPLLLEFFGGFIDHDTKIAHPWYQYTWEDRYLRQKSIYDLLKSRNAAMAGVVNKTYSFTSSASLQNSARMGSIVYTSVDYILYPTEPKILDDVTRYHHREPADLFTAQHQLSGAYSDSTITVHSWNSEIGQEKLLLPKLFEQDYYVVSPYFYGFLKDGSNADEVSFIEVLMVRFIRREAIAREDLLKVIASFYEWSSFHQLYYLPVVLLIIRATL